MHDIMCNKVLHILYGEIAMSLLQVAMYLLHILVSGGERTVSLLQVIPPTDYYII